MYRVLAVLFLAVAQFWGSTPALSGDEYPNKPIRWIVPAPAGGPTDFWARRLADKFTQAWKQQVVVENKAGASGIIGTEAAARAAADGYTLLTGHTGTFAIHERLYQTLPYDPIKDFTPVTLIVRGPHIVFVHPGVPAKTLQELIALAKAKPGELTYGSSGVGSPQHIAGETFKALTGVNLTHVPYKGSAPSIADLIAGQIHIVFDYAVPGAQHVQAGKLRALAVSAAKRIPLMPDVPTAAEAGLAEFELYAWQGLFVRSGTPAGVVAKLHAEAVKTLHDPAERAQSLERGAELIGNTPEEFAAFVKSEAQMWGKLVKASGAKLE